MYILGNKYVYVGKDVRICWGIHPHGFGWIPYDIQSYDKIISNQGISVKSRYTDFDRSYVFKMGVASFRELNIAAAIKKENYVIY